MPRFLSRVPTPLLPLLAIAAPLANASAQDELSATLQALSPIRAEWVTAPPGTPGALMTHPAGDVGAVELNVTQYGWTYAQFLADFGHSATGWRFDASCSVLAPGYGEICETSADLLLTLSAPPWARLDFDVTVGHEGDQPSPLGWRVDIGNDGTFELTTTSAVCCHTRHHRVWSWDFGLGPLQVRILDDNLTGASPQTFTLSLTATDWTPTTNYAGDGCGRIVDLTGAVDLYTSDYRLAAIPPTQPGELTVLRATGLGDFAAFLVGQSPGLVPFTPPLPFVGASNILGAWDFLAFGQVTSTTAVPSEWRLRVPHLPPGLAIYVQHVSGRWASPNPFGATNVVGIRT